MLNVVFITIQFVFMNCKNLKFIELHLPAFPMSIYDDHFVQLNFFPNFWTCLDFVLWQMFNTVEMNTILFLSIYNYGILKTIHSPTGEIHMLATETCGETKASLSKNSLLDF